jgi:lysophospholipase L1-like esterase
LKLDRNKYLKSRSLKPTTLLGALIAVNILLGIIVWAFPEDGISLGQSGKLKFVSYKELLGLDSTLEAVNIDDVLANVEPLEEDTEIDSILEEPDSLFTKINTEIQSSVNFDTITNKLITPKHRSIQIPPSNPQILKSLIAGLVEESKTKVVRIVHYGDSQLEGDRISDYLRNRLQLLFGGEGPGILLPNEPTAGSRRSAYVSQSENLRKKAIYISNQNPPENRYGIGGATFIFNGNTSQFVGWDSSFVKGDSIKIARLETTPKFDESVQTPSYIKINNGSSGYRLARRYSSIKLLYRSENPFVVKLRSDSFTDEFFMNKSLNLGVKTWYKPTYRKLRIDVTKGGFPEIYGLALDGQTGVAVDNFPMRGSSAIGFSKMDRSLYSAQLKALNVRCIILQYGINVVPTVRSDYSYYKSSLSRQLRSIKAAHPGVSIIVVGPSDMSKNKGGNMVSYENIPLIRDAMKGAAFETGCAFWDLYEAMGGQNSMVSWVENGLAQKDYTHFSFRGAKYVGEMLFEAILEQVQNENIVN